MLRLTLLTCALVLALTPTAGFAQNAAAPDWNRTGDTLEGALGVHYGQLGGHGLAFRVPLQWYLYLQVAGGVWHTDDNKRHNIGFNLNYILRQDQRLRLFLSAGLGNFYRRERIATDPDLFDTDRDWNVGGGVGLEYLQGSRWAWKFEANFAHLGRSGDIKVVPQAGLFYYW